MKMNKLYILLLLLPLMILHSCSKDNDVVVPVIKPQASGAMTDVRDGYTYHWVRYGGLDWTVENSHYNTNDENCGIYYTNQVVGEDQGANDARTVANYGYLYNLAGAKEAVPDGWRLPTDNDWQKLEQALGMSAQEAAADGWRGSYQGALLTQGDSGAGMKLLYGGFNDYMSSSFSTHYMWLAAYGYYWTATTADDEALGYIRKIQYNSKQVWRHTTNIHNMLSVRFVRDAQ